VPDTGVQLMVKRFVAVALLLIGACASLLAQETLYQIDLIPSGKIISRDMPQLKGASYLYHAFPAGTLVSVKKSSVKQIIKMSPEAAAAVNPRTALKQIDDLPMQGPKQVLPGSGSGGSPGWSRMDRARAAVSAANAGTAGRTGGPN
jgi:hypothetical protein